MGPPGFDPAFDPAFADGESPEEVEAMLERSRRQRKLILIGVLVCVVLIAVAIFIITAQRATSKPGSVVLETVPSGARVYYRGRLVGTTPHRLDDLSLDEVHWVRLESDRCESKAVRLNVRAGKEAKLVVRLENCEKP
jgi:hypothetical protein